MKIRVNSNINETMNKIYNSRHAFFYHNYKHKTLWLYMHALQDSKLIYIIKVYKKTCILKSYLHSHILTMLTSNY